LEYPAPAGYQNPLRSGEHIRISLFELGIPTTLDPVITTTESGEVEYKTRLDLGRLPQSIIDQVEQRGIQLVDIPLENSLLWEALPERLRRVIRTWAWDSLNDDRRQRSHWVRDAGFRQRCGGRSGWYGSTKLEQVEGWFPVAIDSWPTVAPGGCEVDRRRTIALDALMICGPVRAPICPVGLERTKDLLCQSLLNGWPGKDPEFVTMCQRYGVIRDLARREESDMMEDSLRMSSSSGHRPASFAHSLDPAAKRQAR